jgi:hypothetical protein
MHRAHHSSSTYEAEQRRCTAASILCSGPSLLAFAAQEGVSVATAELFLQQASVEDGASAF